MMATTPDPTPAPRSRRRLRLLAIGAAVCLVVGAGVAHLPFVRGAVLARIVTALDGQGIRLESSGLDYNLFTLTVSLHDVTLAADDAVPFLAVDEIRVNLPWAVVTGHVAAQSVEVDRPTVTLVRSANGELNLPRFESNPDEPGFAGPVVLGRLWLGNLDATYTDVTNDQTVEIRGVTLDMRSDGPGPLTGPLSMAQPATIALAGHSTSIDRLAGTLSFDGIDLETSGLEIEAPEGSVRVDGTVGILGADPGLDLRYDARVDTARAATWVEVSPTPSGSLLASGSVQGPRDEPEVTLVLGGEQLALSSLGPVTLDANTTLSGTTAIIDTLRVGIAGGQLSSTGRVEWNDDGTSTIDATWNGLDLVQLSNVASDLAVRPGAVSSGSLALTWSGTDVMGGQADVSTSLRSLAARRGVLPVSGPLRLQSDASRWTLTGAPVIAGGISIAPNVAGTLADDVTEGPVSGTATIAIRDLESVLAQLGATGLVESPDGIPVAGSVETTFRVAGTLGAPEASGTLTSDDLRISGNPPASLVSRFNATPGIVVIDGLQMTLGANTVEGQATLGIENNSLRGSVRADLPDLAALTTPLPDTWRPEGGASLTADLGGALDNPTAVVRLASGGFVVAGQTVEAMASDLRVEDRVITIDTFELTQRGGRLTATGRYALDDQRYAFNLNGAGLEITPSESPDEDGALPLGTRVDLDFRGEGTVDSPGASGQVRLAYLDWGAYQLGPASADVVVADGSARVQAALPSINGSVDTTIELETGLMTAVATISNAVLAEIARATGPAGEAVIADADDPDAPENQPVPLGGTVSVQANVTGSLDDLAAATATVALDLTDATVNGVPVRLERTARLRHENGTIDADDFELRIGDATLTARGRIGADADPAAALEDAAGLNVSLVGDLSDFSALFALAPGLEDMTLGGAVDLRLVATGPLDTPDVNAYITVTNGRVAMPDLPPTESLAMAATYSAGRVNLSQVSARWQGAELLATGYIPLSLLNDNIPAAYLDTLPADPGPARFDVRVTGLSPQTLEPFLDQASIDLITGRVDLAADVEATALTLDGLTAEVRMDQAAVELARVPLAQTRPTRLRLANRVLRVVDWDWAGTGNQLSVRGDVQLAEAGTTLNLGLAGSLDLRMFSAFTPGVATSGRADLDVTANGPAADPVVDGRVALTGTNVIVRDPRVAITEVTGAVRLTRNRIDIENLTGNANGGTVAIQGGVDYSDFAIQEGALTVTGRRLAIEPVDGLRTEVDTDLRLAMAKGEPTLGGSVTLLRGDYREPLRLTEQLFSTLETPTTGAGADSDGALSTLQLDIAINSAQDIVVDNNYGRLEVGTNLRVTGAASAPILGGRLAMREGGEIFLGGQTYRVQRGAVDFTNATRIEPNFDIALETRVRSEDITLQLNGTPENLEVGLRGPGLSQQDAISLLLTGQKADASSMAYTEVARGQLLMLLSGELLSTAGRAVGLDSVQISRGLGGAASTFDLLATDSDPGARLTLAKDLSREVELIVSQSLSDTGDITWIAVYRPVRRIAFRAATDDDSRETYEFRHEIQFGGEADDAGTTRAPEPRVEAVRIDGQPGVPNAELLSRIRLRVGDGFDYFRWQQDRDRLAAFYNDRGYFEARIAAARDDAGPDGVTLSYDITPGPRTTLRVEGYTLPADVIDAIEEAWSESVFDGFLIDDAETLSRSALVRARHLQSTVTATVSGDADGSTKQLLVTIVPGPRSDTRRIEFTGNTQVSSDRLRTAIGTANSAPSVWLEPSVIATQLDAYYRSLGYLAAEVEVAAPRFEGSTAILPVHITEGPAYRIGMVGVSGAAFRTADAVRTVTGLESGAPYRPAEVEPARRAVEVDYLGAGYNDVSVSAIVGIDDERAVADVVIAVAEGPQQILHDVSVRGAEVTSAGTVTHALNLDLGEPLDESDVYGAQKRLYDTGVFHTVDIDIESMASDNDAPGTEAVRAVVDLRELPRYRFRYGFRVSDYPGAGDGLRQIRPALVADLLDRNLFGRAVSTGVAGQLESNRRLARGIVSVPSLFGLPVVSNVFVTRSRQTFGDADEGITPFVEDRLSLTLEQRITPARAMAVTYGYSFERNRTFEPNPDPDAFLPPLDLRVNTGRLTGTFAWDRRDDPSNTTRGWFHSSGLEYGPGRLGSELRFIRYLAQQYYFHRVGPRVILASAFRVGAGRGYGQDLLPAERFFAGGGASVRGFAEQSIRVVDSFGNSIGGNGLLQFNQEVRVSLFRWIGGVGFFDTAGVFPKASDISFRNLERGAGFGLRINSPFAILRVDYGVPLTSKETERARWYFSIGQTF